MRSYSVLIFSLLLISSIILVSNFGTSFADGVIATSTGFEDSTILELKNSRGNTMNIDSVRIWVGGENEFKSFKTEQGWMGKKELNGVIEFKSQNDVNPGESVKFGIKTTIENPIINWKALDSNGEIISSASTKITVSDSSETVLNQAVEIGIKENSYFRFIPENPSVSCKTFGYFTDLIKSVETFSNTGLDKWVYRIYVDNMFFSGISQKELELL